MTRRLVPILLVLAACGCDLATDGEKCLGADPNNSVAGPTAMISGAACERNSGVSGRPVPLAHGGWLVQDNASNCAGDQTVTRIARIGADGSVMWHDDFPWHESPDIPGSAGGPTTTIAAVMGDTFVLVKAEFDDATNLTSPPLSLEGRRLDNSTDWKFSAADLEWPVGIQVLDVRSDDDAWLLITRIDESGGYKNSVVNLSDYGVLWNQTDVLCDAPPATTTTWGIEDPSFLVDEDGFLIMFEDFVTQGDTNTRTIFAARVNRDGTAEDAREIMRLSWNGTPREVYRKYFPLKGGILVVGLVSVNDGDGVSTTTQMKFVNADGSIRWTAPAAFRNDWTFTDSLARMNADYTIDILAPFPHEYIVISADGQSVTATPVADEPFTTDGLWEVRGWHAFDDGVLVLVAVRTGSEEFAALKIAMFEQDFSSVRWVATYADDCDWDSALVPDDAGGWTVYCAHMIDSTNATAGSPSGLSGTYLHFDSVCGE